VVRNFTGSDETQADLINNITDSNVGGLLITTSDRYTEVSSLWLEFCEELADKDDRGDLPNGDVLPEDDKTKRRDSFATAGGLSLALC
jgi:hypothetical protein